MRKTIKISLRPVLLTSGKIHNRAINRASETKYSDVLVFLTILVINVGQLGGRPGHNLGAKYDCQMNLSIHQQTV